MTGRGCGRDNLLAVKALSCFFELHDVDASTMNNMAAVETVVEQMFCKKASEPKKDNGFPRLAMSRKPVQDDRCTL